MTSKSNTRLTRVEETLFRNNHETFLKILNLWKKEGKNQAPTAPGIPSHPEFIYRLPEFNSAWTGWNDFLGVDKNTNPESYEKNLEQDKNEDFAFKIYVKMGSPSKWWK